MRNLFSYFLKKEPIVTEKDKRPASVIIKKKLKKEFPHFKFSVTEGFSEIIILLISGDIQPLNQAKDKFKNNNGRDYGSDYVNEIDYKTHDGWSSEGKVLFKNLFKISSDVIKISRGYYTINDIKIYVGKYSNPYILNDNTRKVLTEKTNKRMSVIYKA